MSLVERSSVQPIAHREHCPICQDERQFVGLQGQQWTTLENLQKSHRNTIYQEGDGIWGVLTVPQFGIGQRALVVRTGQGNILWDCVSLINPDTVELINALGGISAVAISHPHYYTSMVEWSHAFGKVPVYIHEADRDKQKIVAVEYLKEKIASIKGPNYRSNSISLAK